MEQFVIDAAIQNLNMQIKHMRERLVWLNSPECKYTMSPAEIKTELHDATVKFKHLLKERDLGKYYNF